MGTDFSLFFHLQFDVCQFVLAHALLRAPTHPSSFLFFQGFQAFATMLQKAPQETKDQEPLVSITIVVATWKPAM